jgi:hypothetical protein
MLRAVMAASAILVAAVDPPNAANPANAPAGPSRGPRVDDLVANGFVVLKDTKVIGDFDGCDYGRQVPLAAGGTFTCSGFGYMHARNPQAVLLKSPDGRQYKLVIGSAVFDGTYS